MIQENKEEMTVMLYPVKYRCNLRCQYCFYLNNGHSGQPPDIEVFQSTIERVAPYYGNIKIFWCGGELLLAGKKYFRTVAEMTLSFADAGITIRHVGQTNAVALDHEWIEIFRTLNFEVGLSLDFPLELNNRRVWPNGRPATPEILRGVKLVVNSGLRYKMTSIITKQTLGREQEIAEELKMRFTDNIRQAFAPCYMGPDNASDMFITGAEYAEFIKCITPLLPWRVREAEFARLRDLCFVRSECRKILFVDFAGRWYICSRIFDQEGLLFEGTLPEYQLAKELNFRGQHDCVCLDIATRNFWQEFLDNML